MPNTIEGLLQAESETTRNNCSDSLSNEQLKDQELAPIILYLKDGKLPEDVKLAKKWLLRLLCMPSIMIFFTMYVGPTQTETLRVVVPQQLHQDIMQNYHDGHLAGHFSGPRLYKTLVQRWWWPHMYTDAMNYAK